MEADGFSTGRLAVVGGHNIFQSSYESGGRRIDVAAGNAAPVAVLDCDTHVVVQRHGLDGYRLPHLLPHADTMRALVALGCDRVLALGSSGGLRRELGVGTFVAPDDFISLVPPPSLFDDARGHHVVGFDPTWRAHVVATWARVVPAVPLRDGGVYWQTVGPRFETPAEIRLMAQFADVVGMTIASECAVAGELGLPYAAVCVVDNLANGVGDRELTEEEFVTGTAANRLAVTHALDALVPELV